MTASKILSEPCRKHINTDDCQESLSQLGSREYKEIQSFVQYIVRNNIEVYKIELHYLQ